MSAERRLVGADWLQRRNVRRVFELLDGEEKRTRVVGGAVRDTLVGRTVSDVDFATELLPDEVIRRARAAKVKAVPTGLEHGTVTLVIDGRGFEVTTLRQDIDTDGRHAKVAFGTDWALDAARRDFTLNALYAEMNGTLFDPLGGVDDAVGGRVRFIGDAGERIREDRLRVYRFFRFSASHGGQKFDADGLAACVLAAGDLGQISAERVGHEMTRMLALPQIAMTLQAMTDAGVAAIDAECLADMADYERRCENPSLAGRLAILFEHEKPREVQKRWRLSGAQLNQAERLRGAAHLLSEGAVLEAAYRYGDVARDALPIAGVLGEWDAKLHAQIAGKMAGIDVPPFPINGADLQAHGMEAGPTLGATLKALEAAWIESGFKLTRKELLATLY